MHVYNEKSINCGATGYLGKYVVKAFKQQGYWVRALSKNPKKLDSLGSYIDEVVAVEVTNPDTLNGVCNNIYDRSGQRYDR